MRRIILDTDLAMGAGWDVDDGFALALAVADPEITLDAVTSIAGNTDGESAALLSMDLLERLGVTGVPVYQGALAPLTHPELIRTAPDAIRSTYGRHVPAAGFAAAEIARRITAEPGEITLVPIGPLTNVAAALSLDHRVARDVKEIVIMGGIFLGQTKQGRMPGEFNIWSDPEAAEAVLNSGASIRFVGLDVTVKVRLSRAQAAELAQHPEGSFGRFAGEATNTWIDIMHARFPGNPLNNESCAMHDPLAVAVLSHPEFCAWRPAHVTVVTGPSVARGLTVTDLAEGSDAPEPNCRIATDVDADAFTAHFLRAIGRL
ncbi:nucleoside hydrolase [Rathayibacter sp. CAU 1779]